MSPLARFECVSYKFRLIRPCKAPLRQGFHTESSLFFPAGRGVFRIAGPGTGFSEARPLQFVPYHTFVAPLRGSCAVHRRKFARLGECTPRRLKKVKMRNSGRKMPAMPSLF